MRLRKMGKNRKEERPKGAAVGVKYQRVPATMSVFSTHPSFSALVLTSPGALASNGGGKVERGRRVPYWRGIQGARRANRGHSKLYPHPPDLPSFPTLPSG